MYAKYDMSKEVAIITGGAMGIGLVCAQRLAENGAEIILWDRDSEALEAAKTAFNKPVATIQVDISDPQSVAAAMAASTKHHSRITQLLNSAGIAGPAVPTLDYTAEDWCQVIDINLNGTFYVNQAVLPTMKAQNYGRIVNVASVAGKEGNPNAGAYSASKAGVIGLTKTLGKEMATYDIAVNCITPAAAQTRILEQITQQHIDYMLSKIPRGRFVLTDEIASMVAWLLSAENSFTTASVFDISGGRATY
ncbi:MAG: 2-dehydro-3-deoxy-L-rhamnonate dehydrogenase (NAD(+)) [Rhodospirillaceae bacterium]|nr:SDR family oxidoreductase [Alphaproteobacteria bacterium]MBL6777546.1 SDR family oxidoreductase [Alphaproteobacteria bacterium]CAI8356791.1 MAG: 2-dehydro-3-deoxy-L-rhamnonate dehydrogenase (NAD(+)) [Rhodospirillaceae bacterium]